MDAWKTLGQSIGQFIVFDESSYRRHIESLDKERLREEDKRVKCKLVGSVTAMGLTTTALFTPASPAAAVPAGVAWRSLDINGKRHEIIKQRLAEKRWPGHKMRVRDYFWGALPTMLTHGLAPGIDGLADEGVNAIATRAMTEHGPDQVMNYYSEQSLASDHAEDHSIRHTMDRAASHVAHVAGHKDAGVDFTNAGRPDDSFGELIYKSTHSLGQQRAEEVSAWAVHHVAEEPVARVTDAVVDKAERLISRPSATRPSQSHKSNIRAKVTTEKHRATVVSGNPKPKPVMQDRAESGRSTATTTASSKPDVVSRSETDSRGSVLRLVALLLPVIVYSLSGGNIFWLPCAFGTVSTLRSMGRTALTDLAVPLFMMCISNADYLCLLYVVVAVLEAMRWPAVRRMAKATLYWLSIILACVLVTLIILSVLFPRPD